MCKSILVRDGWLTLPGDFNSLVSDIVSFLCMHWLTFCTFYYLFFYFVYYVYDL